ncbi:hypothetical protein [Thermococcus piezophilus]|uniref:Uncharacterized protein n=1 Tax=Thermococcus piezophilus TaxID=1712654 RepID=A0A172WJ61_9EURY|nr:hypothetical protein [Thermococcus piezophilus]ANF23491.1 hypothetical protein A7C91_10230 [Thermococcus piezophilus]
MNYEKNRPGNHCTIVALTFGSKQCYGVSGGRPWDILVVDSSAEVLVLDENLSFTAPAWVELPATNEGKEYFLILKIDGLEVKIPVLVKEGLTTILKVNGGKIWEAIMTEGAKPIELKFEAPLRLPPKLPGSGQHWNVQ